jgi:hypothetical protein
MLRERKRLALTTACRRENLSKFLQADWSLELPTRIMAGAYPSPLRPLPRPRRAIVIQELLAYPGISRAPHREI